jgi:nitrile hydratase beta subunit
MNGAHDMGGTMGFGAVQPESDEPVFHGDWERKTFALSLAAGAAGGWNIDMGRFAREDRSPREYLNSTYYQLWYAGLVRLLQERGLIGPDEIAAGHALHPAKPVKRVLKPADVLPGLMRRSVYTRETSATPAFAVGDRVRTRIISPSGHTRLPRYVRGKPGTVELCHGAHVFPDKSAHGGGDAPEFLYTVRFTGRDLWGPDADPTLEVSTDCWESYLERA